MEPVSSVAHRDARARSAPAPGGTTLSLLNAFELRCDGRDVNLPVSAQRLVAFVALHGGPLLRVYVAGTLWLHASDERAGASLRSSLWRLNRAGLQIVEASSTHLRLAPEVDVDVQRASELARRLLDGAATDADLDSAEEELRGELLPDWYDDWLVFERERFRQLSLHALEALADRLVAAGRLGKALEVALAALRGEGGLGPRSNRPVTIREPMAKPANQSGPTGMRAAGARDAVAARGRTVITRWKRSPTGESSDT